MHHTQTEHLIEELECLKDDMEEAFSVWTAQVSNILGHIIREQEIHDDAEAEPEEEED